MSVQMLCDFRQIFGRYLMHSQMDYYRDLSWCGTCYPLPLYPSVCMWLICVYGIFHLLPQMCMNSYGFIRIHTNHTIWQMEPKHMKQISSCGNTKPVRTYSRKFKFKWAITLTNEENGDDDNYVGRGLKKKNRSVWWRFPHVPIAMCIQIRNTYCVQHACILKGTWNSNSSQ